METKKVYKIYLIVEEFNFEVDFEFTDDYSARDFLEILYKQNKKAYMQIENKEVFKGE